MRIQLFILTILISIVACNKQQQDRQLPAIILDTDIGPDCDDVGALTIFHALADSGLVVPLAVVASNAHDLVVPSIDILNTFYGRPNLPTGGPKSINVPNDKALEGWPEMIAAKYPHKIKSTTEAPDALKIYRKVLAEQPDSSVTIVTVGFLTNVANLLESPSDEFSNLNGRELVSKKVKKMVSMAGRFPKGREYNVFYDSLASEKVFSKWPTPIVFSGFEIGMKVITGLELINNSSLSSPIKDVYTKVMAFSPSSNLGRMSFDQTAVLYAVKGDESYFGLHKGYYVPEGGNNSWKDDPNGPHAYLTFKSEPEEVRRVIEKLMMHERRK